jgi:hypothetical protein
MVHIFFVYSTLGEFFTKCTMAVVMVIAVDCRPQRAGKSGRTAILLLLAAGMTTAGVLILPRAVRIHHSTLVYPFPHLAIAAAAVFFWQRANGPPAWKSAFLRVTVVIFILFLLFAQGSMFWKTENLVRVTGGRGRWSASLDAFCKENANRADLKIVSLDWGFNEQLGFLTEGPRLFEPFWEIAERGLRPLPNGPEYIYLVHPAEYALLPSSLKYLDAARAAGGAAKVTPYSDREGQIAFYGIQFLGP